MHPLTRVWWELFVNRTDGTLRRGGRGWYYNQQDLTPEVLDAALTGHHALGVYATDGEGLSRWLCLDADDEAGRHGLLSLARQFDSGVSLFEPSRRGAHLWWLCPPTPWFEVRSVGESLARDAGISCEVFPKTAGRSGVRVPLTPHPRSGATYPLVNPTTGEIRGIEDLVQLQRAPLPQVSQRDTSAARSHASAQTWPNTGFAELWDEISHFTRLRQSGPERAVGKCPFHDDRHPSLSLLGGFWRCWAGCGEGGVNAFRAKVREKGWQ